MSKINELELRIARLEKQSSSRAITILNRLEKVVLKELRLLEKQAKEDNPHLDEKSLHKEIRRVKKEWSKSGVIFFIQAQATIKGLIINKIEQQLDSISSKTKKEQMMLKRFLPFDIFNVNQIIKNTGHKNFFNQGKIGELFKLFDYFIDSYSHGRVLRDRQLERFIKESIKMCQELGI